MESPDPDASIIFFLVCYFNTFDKWLLSTFVSILDMQSISDYSLFLTGWNLISYMEIDHPVAGLIHNPIKGSKDSINNFIVPLGWVM